MLPGDLVHRAVDEGVRLWDKVLLCCSKYSLTSWWVDKEIQKALLKEEQLWKERGKEVLAIIPLNLDGHLFSPEWKAKKDWKEQHLTTRLAADFTGWEKDNAKFDAQLEKVSKPCVLMKARVNVRPSRGYSIVAARRQTAANFCPEAWVRRWKRIYGALYRGAATDFTQTTANFSSVAG